MQPKFMRSGLVAVISWGVVHFRTCCGSDRTQQSAPMSNSLSIQGSRAVLHMMLDVRPVKRNYHPFTSLKALAKNSKSQENN